MSRVLALDYGRARAGCAVSDPTGTVATPLAIVDRPATRRGLDEIRRIAEERDVERVVVGLPLTLAGEEGFQAAERARLRSGSRGYSRYRVAARRAPDHPAGGQERRICGGRGGFTRGRSPSRVLPRRARGSREPAATT